MYKELVEHIVKSLVDNPGDVAVSEFEEPSETVIELSVAEADMGRVIGKGGRVVNSIRTIVGTLANKQGDKVSVEIIS